MTTRVSDNGAFLNGLELMQRLRAELDYTQRQIASGTRILTPSDDPIASSRALELRELLSRLDQFDRNASIATNRLSQEEQALSSVNDILQRVRELALQANNATQSNETRSLIAVEMRQLLDNAVQIANQKDGNGRYLFAGNLENVEPVSRAGSVFTYNGDQGRRFIQVGEGREVADSNPGSEVFFRIRQGNGVFETAASPANTGQGIVSVGTVTDPTLYDQDTYTVRFIDATNYEIVDSGGTTIQTGTFQPGDTFSFRGIEFMVSGQPAAGDEFIAAPSRFGDVFTTIDRLATTIEQSVSDDTSRAALTNGINAGLQGLDQALGNILDVRTEVGSRLSVIEAQVDANASLSLVYQETLADIRDLDYAEALSRLSQQITTLEAAQQSFVRTQQLSLFNYF